MYIGEPVVLAIYENLVRLGEEVPREVSLKYLG